MPDPDELEELDELDELDEPEELDELLELLDEPDELDDPPEELEAPDELEEFTARPVVLPPPQPARVDTAPPINTIAERRVRTGGSEA